MIQLQPKALNKQTYKMKTNNPTVLMTVIIGSVLVIVVGIISLALMSGQDDNPPAESTAVEPDQIPSTDQQPTQEEVPTPTEIDQESTVSETESQLERDAARSSDISQIVAAINGYITNNNALPTAWSDIAGTIDDLSHYDDSATDNTSVNPVNSVTASTPATAGDFEAGPATAAFPVKVHTGTDTSAVAGAEDLIIIYREAKCDTATTPGQGTKVIAGSLRLMAIVYKLETSNLVTCQNI